MSVDQVGAIAIGVWIAAEIVRGRRWHRTELGPLRSKPKPYDWTQEVES